MSTGDQSEYIRKKMAERRITSALGSDPTFMKSGFQRWAENERPTRMGGAEKEPLATARDGAKNVLNDVRRLGHQMFQKYYEQSGGARHYAGDEESESDEEEYGGRLMVGDIESNMRGNGMFDASAVGKVALGELGKTLGKVAAPVFEPCETGWKDEGVTCSKTVPKKLKKIGKGKMECVHHEAGEGTVVKKGKGKLEEHAADLMKMAKKGHGREQTTRMVAPIGFMAEVEKLGKGREAPKLFRPVERISSEIMPTKASLMAAEGKVEKMGSGERHVGAGKKKSARGELVKKIMREKGLSLPMASKYVKEHNLYKG